MPQVGHQKQAPSLLRGGGKAATGSDREEWAGGNAAAGMLDGLGVDRPGYQLEVKGLGAAGFDALGFGLDAELVDGGIAAVAADGDSGPGGVDAAEETPGMLERFSVATVPSRLDGQWAGPEGGGRVVEGVFGERDRADADAAVDGG